VEAELVVGRGATEDTPRQKKADEDVSTRMWHLKKFDIGSKIGRLCAT
jgi:hypothetical protein